MPEDLLQTLVRFHREYVLPDVRDAIREETRSLKEEIVASRSEGLSHFDAIYVRFDRLEVEYHALTAAVRRIE